MELIWRRITDSFTLVEMFDVKTRAELPYEYVNGNGPKFWLVPEANVVAQHDEYIYLGKHTGKAVDCIAFLNRLYIGTVLTHKENKLVGKYLLEASRRLHDLNIEIIDAEMVTTIL